MTGYVNAAGVEKIAQLCQQLVNAGGIVLDQTPTQNSTNAVESGGVYTALQGKQNILTFDSAPTDGSSNPVTSDGIYTALDDKQNAITAGTGLEFSGDTLNHSNSVTAGTIGSSSASSGATIAVPYATFDAQGHIKTKGTHTHTIDDLAASAITSGQLAKARGGTGTDGSSVAANRVLASPNGSTGAVSFRALVAADLPDITFNALSDAAITERAAHYSTSINNTTSEYTSAGSTGWTYIKIANTVFAWGFVSASVAISTAFGSLYISGADRYMRLPVAMTNIVSCIFGTAFGGASNSGVSAVLRGNNADYLPTSGSLYCLPFRFTSPASVGTAATQKVPVMLVGRAA